MQDLTPRLDANAQLIQSYGAGGFRIANVDYTTSVAVFTEHTAVWDGALTVESILKTVEKMEGLEVLLIGTGAKHEWLGPEIRNALKVRGIALDTMATGAAARTFNILLGEARRVAALLQLVA